MLERGNAFVGDAEYLEGIDPEWLALTAFIGGVSPGAAEPQRAGFDLFPRQLDGLSALHAIAPVVGLAMLVGDGNHDQVIAFQPVDHAVGKAVESAAACVGAQRVPRQWKPLDEMDCLEGFDKKGVAQSGRLVRVPRDRVVEFPLRWIKQQDVHAGLASWYFATTSESELARISPRR